MDGFTPIGNPEPMACSSLDTSLFFLNVDTQKRKMQALNVRRSNSRSSCLLAQLIRQIGIVRNRMEIVDWRQVIQ